MILIFGVYFYLQEHGARARLPDHDPEVPDQGSQSPHLRPPESRFTHDYFYIRDPIVMRVATFTRTTSTGTASSNRSLIGRRLVIERMTTPSWLSTMLPHCRRLQTGFPQIIRKRLDYWTFVLGPKFSEKRAQKDQSVAV